MPITSLDSYIASTKQVLQFDKNSTYLGNGGIPYSLHGLTGHPGTMGAPSNINITNAELGYPKIVDTGSTLYLTRVAVHSAVMKRLDLYDCLHASYRSFGTPGVSVFTINTDTATRFPTNNSVVDYTSSLWVEMVTNPGSNPSIAITYTNQDGVPGRETQSFAIQSKIRSGGGAMVKLPLQSGDTGVRSIQTCTVATSTGFSFYIRNMRFLYTAFLSDNSSVFSTLADTGMPEVFPTSAIFPMTYLPTYGTALGKFLINIEVAG